MLCPRPSGTKEIQKMLAQIKIFLREVITTVYLFFFFFFHIILATGPFTQAAVTAGKTSHPLSHKPSPSRSPLAQLQYHSTRSLSNTSHPNSVCTVTPSAGFTQWLLERLNHGCGNWLLWVEIHVVTIWCELSVRHCANLVYLISL